MGGSQSQEPEEAPGGTSPAKSPAKTAPAAPAPGGSSPAKSPAEAAAAPAPAGGEKPKEAPAGNKTNSKTALPAGLVATVPTGGSQICVRNLPKDAKEEDLRKQFKGFGKITDVSVKTFENGEGKGYGFITFKKLEEAQKAIEGMHEKPQPEGKPLLVTMAAHQPGEGKGKGKDGGEKGKGTGSKVSKTAALPAGLVGTAPAAAATGGGKKPKKEVPTGSQICVRNLSKDAKEEDLRKQFKGFGKITDVSVKTFENGQGKGYGFITFKKLEEAQKAIEGMHEKPQPEGKPLLVTMGTRQPGEGKGKGKDGGEKGQGKGKGKGGKGKGEAKGQYPYGDSPYSHEQGKPLSLTMATRPPGEGPGKGKDGGEKGKGRGDGQQNAPAPYQYPYGYYPYSQEQVQAWAMQLQYYQQAQQAQAQQAQQALQAQAYYRGLTGGVIIPSEAAISSASCPAPDARSFPRESAAPAAAAAPSSDKVYTGQVKSISNKNGYGFIACSETKALYSRDVFVDATLLPDIQVNSKVTFTVELSQKGHPRASKVVKIADAD